MSSRTKKLAGYLSAFVLPVALLCCLFTLRGVYPFGPDSFLTEDLKYQYIDFFTWYRQVLSGQTSIFYSLAQGLGSSTWGLYSYYLASPFNVLILCFDENHITLAIFVICMLKVGCIGLSVVFYLRRRFGLAWPEALVGALCFTCATWMLTNVRNPLWLDAMIIVPIMMWAATCFARHGKWRLLCACVVAAIITCWYMAYMLILFITLYVFFELAQLRHMRPRHIGKLALRYMGTMVLALLFCAWTFVPTIMAMRTVASQAPTEQTSIFSCGLSELVGGLFAGIWQLDANPQLYISVLFIVLAAYFFAGRAAVRIKLAAAVFTLFLVSSVWLLPFEYVWCGFRYPNGFYCRIAFCFDALMLWLASAGWVSFKRSLGFTKGTGEAQDSMPVPNTALPLRSACTRLAVTFVLLAALVALGVRLSSFRGTKLLLLNGSLILFYMLLLFVATLVAQRTKSHKVFGAFFVVAAFALVAELAYSGTHTLSQLYTYYTQDYHDAYVAGARAQLAELKAQDSSAYRFEKTYRRAGAALNEGIALGFSQLSTYSSVQNGAAANFLNALGYSNPGEFSVMYTNPILLSDSLLGVRYVSQAAASYGLEATGIGQDGTGAQVYSNPYALALGYGASSAVTSANLDTSIHSNNPFEVQNAFVSALLGTETACYKPLEATSISSSATQKTWDVVIPEGTYAYAYVSAATDDAVTLTINGASVQENWRFGHAIREITGSHATVSISSDDALTEGTTVLFYYLDADILEQVISQLSAHQMQISQFEGNKIAGTYRADQDGYMLLSVPYDTGWALTINGESYQAEPAFEGALMAIPVRAGTNYIELTYTSPGFVVGCAITAGTLVAILVSMVVRRRRAHG